MKDRIKEIRKLHNMNQSQLAEDLGVPVSNIQSYETNRRSPSDAFVKLICSKYNISETWLRSGEGEMMRPLDRNEEIARITDQMLDEVEPSIRNNLHKIVADMTEDELAILLKYARKLVEEMDEENPTS